MPRRLTGAARMLVRLGLLAVLGTGVVAGGTTALVWRQGSIDERRPVDAIVVLGAAQYDGRPSPVFEARLSHAVSLFHDGLAPLFVVTGGGRPGDRTTESAVARAYAEAHGVPAAAIAGDDEARNTLESLHAVAAELRARGLRSALFVSDPTHLFRVLWMARDLGIEAYGSPATDSPVQRDLGRRLRATAHELAGLAVYLATGGSRSIEDTEPEAGAGDSRAVSATSAP